MKCAVGGDRQMRAMGQKRDCVVSRKVHAAACRRQRWLADADSPTAALRNATPACQHFLQALVCLSLCQAPRLAACSRVSALTVRHAEANGLSDETWRTQIS